MNGRKNWAKITGLVLHIRHLHADGSRRPLLLPALVLVLAWVGASAEKTEPANLVDVLRDVEIEIKQLFPDRDIAYDLELAVPVIVAGRHGLFRIFVELARLALSVARAGDARLVIGSTSQPGAVAIRVALATNAAPRPGCSFAGLESRFEFLVARELLATWNGTLALEENTAAPCFILRLPKEAFAISG